MLQLVKRFRRIPATNQTLVFCGLVPKNSISCSLLQSSHKIRLFSTSSTQNSESPFLTESGEELIRPYAIFICPSCDRSFKSQKSLKQHQKLSKKCSSERQVLTAEGFKEYKETIIFPSSNPFLHEDQNFSKVEVNPRVEANPKFEVVHPKPEEQTSPSPSIQSSHSTNCEYCGTFIRHRNNISRHYKTCKVLKEMGGLEFVKQMKSAEKEMLVTVEEAKEKVLNKAQIVECPYCYKILRGGNLKRHLKTCPVLLGKQGKTKELPQCEHCGTVFQNRSNLTRHYKSCPVLNKKQNDNQNSEAEKQLYPCPSCGKIYSRKSNLTKHAATCTGVQENRVKSKEPISLIENLTNIEVISDPKSQSSDVTPGTQKISDSIFTEKQQILESFFDLMVNIDSLSDANNHFESLKNNYQAVNIVQTLPIYNSFLRGFARENNVSRVEELWKELHECGLKPDLNSYISALLGFHEADPFDPDLQTAFNKYLNEFETSGLTLETALSQGDFVMADKRLFLKAIEKFSQYDSKSHGNPSEQEQSLLVNSLKYVGTSHLQSQVETVLSRDQLDQLLEKQLEIEKSLLVEVPSITEHPHAETIKTFTDSLKQQWRRRVENALERLYIKGSQPIFSKGQQVNLRQFLTVLPPEKLTDIVMARTEEMLTDENYSDSITNIRTKFGDDVNTMYHTIVRTDPGSFKDYLEGINKYQDWYCHPQDSEAVTHREALEISMKDASVDTKMLTWPRSVRLAIGAELLHVMMSEIVIDRDIHNNVVLDGMKYDKGQIVPANAVYENDPAFFKIFRKRKAFDIEELKPHPSLSGLFDISSLTVLKFPPSDLPMLSPPLPWVSYTTGGNIIKKNTLVRYPEMTCDDHEKLLDDLPPGGLNPVLDSINQLGSVAWIVNKPILDLACQLFVGQSPDMPPEMHQRLNDLDLPLNPNNIPDDMHQLSGDIITRLREGNKLTPEQAVEYRNYHRDKSMFAKVKSEAYSLWCTSLYRLSLAKHFEDNVLWFPHNIDFRGRCYPIPPLLNHMGADLARSLLVFARGKKLGENGFYWLKLHCINLTGSMKRDSIENRLAHVDSIMDKIIDSASNPLDGQRWWLESDDPWQTLSACIEIKKAMEHPEGVEEYVCHLPIHQDGSCNGLQHYAAMGRDILGAGAVNLVPADKPQDVYSEIAAIVDRKRAEESEAGVDIAKVCEGFVKRKVVKQTVMTTVYGVTKYGAQLQIRKQLKDIDDFPMDRLDEASKYLAKKTFESLNELFTASQDIQDWLTECANVISKYGNCNVQWVTPIGFPVIQPYSKVIVYLRSLINFQLSNNFCRLLVKMTLD